MYLPREDRAQPNTVYTMTRLTQDQKPEQPYRSDRTAVREPEFAGARLGREQLRRSMPGRKVQYRFRLTEQ